MKAYQVFEGEINKHGYQLYNLIATYLDKEKALTHCKQIVESTQLCGDILEEEFYGEGKFKIWERVNFWERVTIAKFQQIDIIE